MLKLKLQYFGHLMQRADSLEKTLILPLERLKSGGEGEDTKDETVGWHHRLNGHELEEALGDGEGQGGPACCSPWGRKESDMTERLNNNKRDFTGGPLVKHQLYHCRRCGFNSGPGN